MPSDPRPAAAADVTVRAIAANVPRVRTTATRAARWLGADEATVSRIALAVSEAAGNAVMHAFPGPPGTLHLTVTEAPGGVDVVVADDGAGLSPRPDSPGLGLGLGLIAEVADDLATQTHPGRGTSIVMRFSPRL